MDDTALIITSIATFAAVISAIYAIKSARTAKKALDDRQTPVLTLEHDSPYIRIRNIGRDTAKKINWSARGATIVSSADFTNILVPYVGSLTATQTISSGCDVYTFPLVLEMEPNNEARIILNYENIQGKKFQSKVLIKKQSDESYIIRLLSHSSI
ncbi:TPA: hypothetical protein DDW69_00220 [candidate division CPR2 bacterium]|uniref:Uncharacterized protein n=1 Tax=candidate division CPR2 bacterium GW2011_GWC1_41_48 TaxID=1618344 RepID=A0A0G0W6W6_UNCC2|nr:MAG: hypothetical protein UT47_C0005G0025 [candidate division CPR2 bacterium GW2011_GWC2_39_35]KKR27753.1 MAG: hypothetical protein UT59_C0045G0007 [candidate division CPR2 bacterium GW2011_GWD1_39_7]KKR28492.1 MAG: hypothetical protein UT60_C0019G0027 [candidate division CPR2 bacterium GW2011_GWD2_39_7]KKS08714.1 MAG: hypothetical protein UU65_C0005G0025 [candidate division CPR2 bacterium GW2011_GWC1_41_48]OGB59792.1 MAG: hypothetical protein A2Y27_02190 [candidate division CPR2 bacterium G